MNKTAPHVFIEAHEGSGAEEDYSVAEGGVLIPKEKDAANISQYRPRAPLSPEEKVFFSVIAERIPTDLRRNEYNDASVHRWG